MSVASTAILRRQDALGHLVRVNVDELLRSFRVDVFGLRALFRLVFTLPSILFSRQLLAMDARIGRSGLPAGAAWMLGRHTSALATAGACAVPRTGPVLVTSNHPGLSDALALMAAIGRPDLRVIAAERPLLRALPHLTAALCYVPDQGHRRGDVLREGLRHLRAGGALLTFPAGSIEPDPALHEDAGDTLAGWSESVALLARMEPRAAVVPALVSGVVSRAARRNPLARLYPTRRQREWVAATLQAMFRRYQRGTVMVSFAGARRFGEGTSRETIMGAVREETLGLIRRVRHG